MTLVNVPFIEIENFNGGNIIPWKLSPIAIQEIFSVLREGEEITAVLAEDIAPTSPRKAQLEEAKWKEFILCTLEDRKRAGQIINCRIVDPWADDDGKEGDAVFLGDTKGHPIKLIHEGIKIAKNSGLPQSLKGESFFIFINKGSRTKDYIESKNNHL